MLTTLTPEERLFQPIFPIPNIAQALHAVSIATGVADDLLADGRNKTEAVSNARAVAALILTRVLCISTPKAALALGLSAHSSVHSARFRAGSNATMTAQAAQAAGILTGWMRPTINGSELSAASICADLDNTRQMLLAAAERVGTMRQLVIPTCAVKMVEVDVDAIAMSEPLLAAATQANQAVSEAA